jgi:hypothetical protein
VNGGRLPTRRRSAETGNIETHSASGYGASASGIRFRAELGAGFDDQRFLFSYSVDRMRGSATTQP